MGTCTIIRLAIGHRPDSDVGIGQGARREVRQRRDGVRRQDWGRKLLDVRGIR
jgi:hypothetical protein